MNRRPLLAALWLVAGCVGETPEKPPGDPPPCPTWYADLDADGYGSHLANPVESCNPPPNHVENNLDCNDQDSSIHPEAIEVCDAAKIDEDCDGLSDNDDPDFTGGSVEAWPDADGDGQGDMNVASKAWCEMPDGWTESATDCDDSDPFTYAGAAFEESDLDCMTDVDGDGWGDAAPSGSAMAGSDCDDDDDLINPGAPDPFDGTDQNCDTFDGAGLEDGFEMNGPDPSVWLTVTGNLASTNQFVAQGGLSMDIYGTGGLLESVVADTSTCPKIFWRYLGYQPVDTSITPDVGDFLYLEYYNGTTWVQLDRWEGGLLDGRWHERYAEVDDPDVLASDFRVRFRGASTATSDHFYVDHFMLACFVDSDSDGRPDPLDCAPNDGAHWLDCGKCVDTDGDDHGSLCDLGPDCDDTDATVNALGSDDLVDGLDGNCDGIDGPAEVRDDFENGGAPDPATWANVSGNVLPSTTYAGEGTTSMDFFGAGGLLESHPFDTSACPSVVWSYLGMNGGAGAAEINDYLYVEYWDGTAWRTADTWEGLNGPVNTWHLRRGVIDAPAALHADFAIRLRGQLNSTADHFYVDDVLVGCGAADADGDGLPHGLDCDDTAGAHWSDCGLCVDGDADGYGAACDLGPDCDDADATISPAAADPDGDGIDADCSGFDGEPALFHDFETDPLATDWTRVSPGNIYWTQRFAVSGSRSLRVEANGTVELAPIAACTTFAWEYMGKRGPEIPETTNYLHLEVLTTDGWATLDRWAGNNAVDPTFLHREGIYGSALIDDAAFQVRFRGQGEVGDDWYIDDFRIHCMPDADQDGIPDAFDCAVNDPDHWSDCGKCIDVDGDGFGGACDLGMDCDDGDFTVNPLAVDAIFDGFDEDCDGFDGGPFLFDDFEPSGPDAAVWSTWYGNLFTTSVYVGEGTRSIDIAYNNSGIESHPIDTTSCPAVTWSFEGMTGGAGQADPEDYLYVEYWTGSSWIVVDSWQGLPAGDPDVNVWQLRRGAITNANAFHPDFKLRLRGSSNSTADHYYVDMVQAGCSGPDMDGDEMPSGLDCDDNDPWHWFDCGFCVDADSDGYGNHCDLGLDCSDADPAVHPSALDQLRDGIDQDCNGIDGARHLYDEFETSVFDAAVWSNVGANVTTSTSYRGQGSRSLDIAYTGTLESVPVNTSTCNFVVWKFLHMNGGAGAADPEDFLHVEYWDGANWITAHSLGGGSQNLNQWIQRAGVITDPGAAHGGFKLRLRGAANSTADHFYIDVLELGCSGPDGDGDRYPAGVDCDDTDFWHWYDCGACTDDDGDGFGAGCDLGPDCDDDDVNVAPAIPDPGLDGIDDNCDGLDLLGWKDDFETGGVQIALLGANVRLEPSADACGAFSFGPCGSYLRMDGQGPGNATETVAWNSLVCNRVGWSFDGQRNNTSAPPEAGNNMYLEWNAGAGWVRAYDWLGGSGDATWSQHAGVIDDPAALSPNLRFRFVGDGSSAIGDAYHIDNLRIGCFD